MPHPNTPGPVAAISIGGATYLLGGTPEPGRVPVPGTAALILGQNPVGQTVVITTASIDWLDALDAAVQAARAQGIVQAGMAVPS